MKEKRLQCRKKKKSNKNKKKKHLKDENIFQVKKNISVEKSGKKE